MKAVRQYNVTKYRQPRFHLVEGDGTIGICGADAAATSGTRLQTRERADLSEYEICAKCRRKADGTGGAIKLSIPEMKALHARAVEAAEAAFHAARPTPMVVGTPKNMMASLMGEDDGGLDPDEPIYHVPEGPCGFAWVTVRPGGSRFANWLKKEGIGSSAYQGGVSVWSNRLAPCSAPSQSYERLYAAAGAYAEVLRASGITAHAGGRLD